MCAQNFEPVRIQDWNLKQLCKPDQKFAHTRPQKYLQLLLHRTTKTDTVQKYLQNKETTAALDLKKFDPTLYIKTRSQDHKHNQ